MNSAAAPDARTLLDAWRERGADRLDPVRFHFIEALARRTAGHSGAARDILDRRLCQLLKTYSDDLENSACFADNAADTPSQPGPVLGSIREPVVDAVSKPVSKPAQGPLAGLLDDIASHARENDDSLADNGAANRRAAYPELDLLDYFKEIWSRVSTDRQLRQSLEQVHENAGPLNSSRLVHRALQLMRELSPGYLHQFLSYADALSWMEQLNGAGVSAGKDAPRATPKKSARGK
jgi:hypothetical protein